MSRAAQNFIKKKRVRRPVYLPTFPKKLVKPIDQGAYLLDNFNPDNIDLYKKVQEQLRSYFYDEYFFFASERAKKESQILDALNQQTQPLEFENYFRCVSSQYSNKPLSSAGSRLSRIGGRFNFGNIGAGVTSFPALYIGQTAAISKSEFFQKNANDTNSISLEDFMKKSVSVNRVHGKLSSVLDITNVENLKSFLKIISKIKLDDNLNDKAIAAGLTAATPSVASMKALVNALLDPNWRDSVVRFDIPSNSQLFGELVKKSKIEAIVYESKYSNEKCLAIFPENLGAHSFVELSDAHPAGVVTRLDSTTFSVLI
jgi:hypothetical protein